MFLSFEFVLAVCLIGTAISGFVFVIGGLEYSERAPRFFSVMGVMFLVFMISTFVAGIRSDLCKDRVPYQISDSMNCNILIDKMGYAVYLKDCPTINKLVHNPNMPSGIYKGFVGWSYNQNSGSAEVVKITDEQVVVRFQMGDVNIYLKPKTEVRKLYRGIWYPQGTEHYVWEWKEGEVPESGQLVKYEYSL